MEEKSIAGRTVQVVSDLSIDEQLYLYERARRFKASTAASRAGGALAAAGRLAPPLCAVPDEDVPLKVDDRNATVYLLFMEGSTRTRESLRNAGIFHNVKVNEFQAETSSFQKNETITDTMKMLSVYSTGRTVFIVRSPMEGVCSWLGTVLPTHTSRFGIPKPSFVNAGDGRYTHPVNEYVDAFSLLETTAWNRSSIHLALIGDLAHGRTAHSKVEGLRVFERVRVDLIDPGPFQYLVEYRNKMRERGFEVREFGSLREYLDEAADSLAATWYFYQPQFKLCGDMAPAEQESLLARVSFRAEWCDRLPAGTRFFQTLPRDQKRALVPKEMDVTPLNGWDQLANNSYFVHIVLLAMLFGKVGPSASLPQLTAKKGVPKAYQPFPRQSSNQGVLSPFGSAAALPDFICTVDPKVSAGGGERRNDRAKESGTKPLHNGLVVDHIRTGKGGDAEAIWRTLRQVRMLMGWSKFCGAEGVYESHKFGGLKGIMSLPNFDLGTLAVPEMKVLASVAPGCTVNLVSDSRVVGKYRLRIPERIYNLPSISCKNELCVSNPCNKQRDVVSFFERVSYYETSALPGRQECEYLFVCKYCRWPHEYSDIWTVTRGSRGSASY